MVEKSFGPDDLRLTMPLQQMAELKTEDGNYPDAEKLYQRAIRINENTVGRDRSFPRIGAGGIRCPVSEDAQTTGSESVTDRASALFAPRTPNNTALNPAASVPYILRFRQIGSRAIRGYPADMHADPRGRPRSNGTTATGTNWTGNSSKAKVPRRHARHVRLGTAGNTE